MNSTKCRITIPPTVNVLEKRKETRMIKTSYPRFFKGKQKIPKVAFENVNPMLGSPPTAVGREKRWTVPKTELLRVSKFPARRQKTRLSTLIILHCS